MCDVRSLMFGMSVVWAALEACLGVLVRAYRGVPRRTCRISRVHLDICCLGCLGGVFLGTGARPQRRSQANMLTPGRHVWVTGARPQRRSQSNANFHNKLKSAPPRFWILFPDLSLGSELWVSVSRSHFLLTCFTSKGCTKWCPRFAK